MDNRDYLDCKPMTLMDILNLRDSRVEKQKEMLQSLKQEGSLVCFTMNISGPYKTFSLVQEGFLEGVNKIRILVGSQHILEDHMNIQDAGFEYYCLTDQNAENLKRELAAFEDMHPIGRLFDIDVLDAEGYKVSRSVLGLPDRKCLICNENGHACTRGRKHPVSELQAKTIKLLRQFVGESFSDSIAEKIIYAMLTEVSVTPKPGLVDRADNGAHQDMNFMTFIKSSSVLYKYFRKITLHAYQNCEKDMSSLFKDIRLFGRLAEHEMFMATAGINTHKGAIFSFALLAASAGILKGRGEKITSCAVADESGKLAVYALDDFENKLTDITAGIKIYREHQWKGIRGEAIQGFPSVMNIALPVMRKGMQMREDMNETSLKALLQLMLHVEDTNMFKRGGEEGVAYVRQQIESWDESKESVENFAGRLNVEMIKRNISPGGCADLLAVTFFMKMLDT